MKMDVLTIKIPPELKEYLEQIIKAGYAENISGAVRAIITERMVKDEKIGAITPIIYRPVTYNHGPVMIISETSDRSSKKRSAEDAPHNAGPLPAKKDIVTIQDSAPSNANGYQYAPQNVLTIDEYERSIKERPELAKYLPKPKGYDDKE